MPFLLFYNCFFTIFLCGIGVCSYPKVTRNVNDKDPLNHGLNGRCLSCGQVMPSSVSLYCEKPTFSISSCFFKAVRHEIAEDEEYPHSGILSSISFVCQVFSGS